MSTTCHMECRTSSSLHTIETTSEVVDCWDLHDQVTGKIRLKLEGKQHEAKTFWIARSKQCRLWINIDSVWRCQQGCNLMTQPVKKQGSTLSNIYDPQTHANIGKYTSKHCRVCRHQKPWTTEQIQCHFNFGLLATGQNRVYNKL